MFLSEIPFLKQLKIFKLYKERYCLGRGVYGEEVISILEKEGFDKKKSFNNARLLVSYYSEKKWLKLHPGKKSNGIFDKDIYLLTQKGYNHTYFFWYLKWVLLVLLLPLAVTILNSWLSWRSFSN